MAAVGKRPVAVICSTKAPRDELRARLRGAAGLDLRCEHPSIDSARPNLLGLKISVVILHHDRPEGACADIRKLNTIAPRVAIVLFSACREPESILLALAAGALAYVVASSPIDQLIRAVHDVSEGRLFLGVQARWAAMEYIRRFESAPVLTDREREICVWLCSRDEKGVARGLKISVQTVHTHAKAIYKKLGVHGRRRLLDRLATATEGAYLSTTPYRNSK